MKKDFLINCFTLLVFGLFAFVYGMKPVEDVDLGWHLAGGLWILENGGLPIRDPLGAQGSYWLCYSWLVEVFFAWIYRSAGFYGLQLLQAVSIVLSLCLLYCYLQIASRSRDDDAQTILQRLLPNVLTLLLVLPLIAPVWYVRPQLFSLIFFILLMVLLEKERLRWFYCIPLTVLWVNVHIYWGLVPFVVFVAAMPWKEDKKLTRFFRAVLIAAGYTLVGLLNPYGIEHFLGLFEYVFQHRAAYSLIEEFQHLSPAQGYVFWVYLLVVALLLTVFRRLIQQRKLALLIIVVFFAVASLIRIKFVPLFAVSAAPLLVRDVFPMIVSRFIGAATQESVAEEQSAVQQNPGKWAVAGLLMVVFLVLIYQCFPYQGVLVDKHREMIEIAQRLEGNPLLSGTLQVDVLNQFNDGGWLELSFFLAKGVERRESRFKTVIDGRTLVVGQKRLTEYNKFVGQVSGWREIVESWGVRIAVLPKGTEFIPLLLKGDDSSNTEWNVLEETEHWTVLIRGQLIS